MARIRGDRAGACRVGASTGVSSQRPIQAHRAGDKVGRLHRKALALGGKDEGAPGQRFDGFYAGYFRDLDGNKLNAYFSG